MHKILLQSLAIPLLGIAFIACKGDHRESTLDLPAIDWTDDIPSKSINLEDIADVRYIPLEVNDSCLIDIATSTAINDEFIVITASTQNKVFIFDLNGKYISQIDRHGEGPEEYPWISATAVDFDKNEVYVYSRFGNSIYTYDFNGKFINKCVISRPGMYEHVYNYNDSLLIAHDFTNLSMVQSMENDEPYRYITIDKISGEAKALPIRIDNPIGTSIQVRREKYVEVFKISGWPIACEEDRFVIADFACDTIYAIVNNELSAIACQQGIDRAKEFPDRVSINAAFGNLLFLTYLRILDASVKGVTIDEEKSGEFVYDLSNGQLMRYEVKMPFMTEAKIWNKISPINTQAPTNTYVKALNVEQLFDLRDEGLVQGPMLDIIDSLDDDANPVVMIAKFKDNVHL